MEFESENRLSQQFKRIVSDRTYEDADINAVNANINKNIYIRTKNMRDSADEMDYFLDKMDLMGKASIDLINNRPRVEPSAEDKTKKKTKRKVSGLMGGIAAAIIPLMFIGGSLLSSKSSAPVAKTNNLKTNTIQPPEKEDNLFGLNSKDKANLRQLNIKADGETNILDKVTRIVSSGFISSFGGLVFGYKSFKDSGIYKMFKENLHAYSEEIAGIFNKVIKNIFTWIRDNIIDPIHDMSEVPVDLFTALKEKVSAKLTGLMDIGNSATEVSTETKKDKTVKTTILTSINQMIVKYIGSGKLSEKVKKYRKNNKKSNVDKKSSSSQTASANSENGDTSSYDFGPVDIDSNIVTKGIVSNLAVYKSLMEAGFGPGQAAVLTAEVGRENDFVAKTLFGGHPDPATGNNIGMISWQGKDRTGPLIAKLKGAGVLKNMKPFKMDQTYKSLMVMSNYIMWEMKQGRFAKQPKTLEFLKNKNITFSQAAPLLGGADSYIGWARGQATIKQKNGPRKAWDWKAHEARARKHYDTLGKSFGGKGDEGDGASQDTRLKGAEKPVTFAETAVLSDYNMELEIESINRRAKKYSSRLLLGQSTHTPPSTQSPKRINTSSAPRTSSKTNGTIDNTGSSSSSGAPKENNPSLFEILMYNDISGNMLN